MLKLEVQLNCGTGAVISCIGTGELNRSIHVNDREDELSTRKKYKHCRITEYEAQVERCRKNRLGMIWTRRSNDA